MGAVRFYRTGGVYKVLRCGAGSGSVNRFILDKESVMAVKIGFSSSEDIKRMIAVNAVNDARLQALRGSGSVHCSAVDLIKAVNGGLPAVMRLLESRDCDLLVSVNSDQLDIRSL